MVILGVVVGNVMGDVMGDVVSNRVDVVVDFASLYPPYDICYRRRVDRATGEIHQSI